MALSVGEIEATLRLRDQMSAQLATASTKVGEFGAKMTSLGTSLLPVSLAVGAIGGGAIKAAVDFESSFTGVRKTVDATEAQFQALSDAFRKMATEIPISVNELNNIGAAAGQLGIETENIVTFTKAMANLGVATDLTSTEAATALARFANITQMPQENFERLGSTIVSLGNSFAATEPEIVNFGVRIAGAGQLAGLTEPQILAIGTAMASIGVQAEAGGTSVQKVLNAMTAAVATGGPELMTFAATAGLSAQQFADAYKQNAAGAFTAFVSGLGQEGAKAFTTLGTLGLENERVIRSFLSLAQAGDLLPETLANADKAWRDNTALAAEAATRYATLASQATILSGQIREVGITIGTALMPMLQRLTAFMQANVVPAVQFLADKFAALPTPVQGVVAGLLALVVAAAPLLIAFGLMATAIAAIPFASIGVALAALTGPIGIVVAAIAGLTAIWVTWGDDITQIVSKTMTAVKTWLVDFYDGSILQSVVNLLIAMSDLWVALKDRVILEVTTLMTAVKDWIVDKLQPVIDAVKPILIVLSDLWTTAKTVISDIAKAIFTAVKTWLVDKFTSIVAGVKAKIDAVTEFFSDMKDKVVGKSFVPDMIKGIKVEFGRLSSVMVDPTKNTTMDVRQLFQDLSGPVLESFDGMMGGLHDSATTWTTKTFGAKGAMSSILSGGFSAMLGPGGLVSGLFQKGMQKLGSLALSGLKKIGGFFKRLFGGASAQELAGRQVVQNFESNLAQMLTGEQTLEAGNVSWKKTVIAIRDAYIANGLTERDALRDAEVLWQSSKLSAEEQQAVIETITTRMGTLGTEIGTTSQTGTADIDTMTSAADNMDAAMNRIKRSTGNVQKAIAGMKDSAIGNLRKVTAEANQLAGASPTGFEEVAWRVGLAGDAIATFTATSMNHLTAFNATIDQTVQLLKDADEFRRRFPGHIGPIGPDDIEGAMNPRDGTDGADGDGIGDELREIRRLLQRQPDEIGRAVRAQIAFGMA